MPNIVCHLNSNKANHSYLQRYNGGSVHIQAFGAILYTTNLIIIFFVSKYKIKFNFLKLVQKFLNLKLIMIIYLLNC